VAEQQHADDDHDDERERTDERQGDTVTLVYALPVGAAPTEFKTREKQMMFTLKKRQAK